MATAILSRASTAQSVPSHIDLSRIYRVFLSPDCSCAGERTVFVNALSRQGAVRKVAAAVAALEFGTTPESVADRAYNCESAVDLINTGISKDHMLRLFETGVCGSKVTAWIEQPLFLVRAPAGLIRAWAAIPTGV